MLMFRLTNRDYLPFNELIYSFSPVENQFISVLGKRLRNLIGLSDQEISELADYFKVQDGRVFYRQLCDVIHKSGKSPKNVPD